MAKCVCVALMIQLLSLAALAEGRLPSVEKLACDSVSGQVSLPDRLREGRRRRPVWQQVDDVLIRLLPALQGQQCSYRFSDLFKGVDDDEFVPLTNRLLSVLPADSLDGLMTYDQSGRQLGLFADRTSRDTRHRLPSSEVFFSLGYETPDGRLRSTERRLLDGNVLLKWGDVKDRIAVSTVR